MRSLRARTAGWVLALAIVSVGMNTGRYSNRADIERETGGVRRMRMVRVLSPFLSMSVQNSIDGIVARVLKRNDFEKSVSGTKSSEFTSAEGFHFYENCTIFHDPDTAESAQKVLHHELSAPSNGDLPKSIPVLLDDSCGMGPTSPHTAPPDLPKDIGGHEVW